MSETDRLIDALRATVSGCATAEQEQLAGEALLENEELQRMGIEMFIAMKMRQMPPIKVVSDE